ncbi:hypothetical protein GCM10023157_33260 [Gluconacetobacter asukensis]
MPDLLRLSRTSLGKHDDARLGQEIRPARRCLSREKPHHLSLVTMLIGDGEIAEGTIQLNEIVKVSRHDTYIVVTALIRTGDAAKSARRKALSRTIEMDRRWQHEHRPLLAFRHSRKGG